MVYHVLNGDAVSERFRLLDFQGEMLINRECLIEGDLSGETLRQFWLSRANYISSIYHQDKSKYFSEVVAEFEKLLNVKSDTEFNLWFGYDLFCQVNLWFVLSLIYSLDIKKTVYAVYPTFLKSSEIWNDYANATIVDLKSAFNQKIQLNEDEIYLGFDLWDSFKKHDLNKLRELSSNPNKCFPYLKEVIQAHVERFPADNKNGRPEEKIIEIINNDITDFESVFTAFSKTEGVYGFGDLQVKHLYDKIIGNKVA